MLLVSFISQLKVLMQSHTDINGQAWDSSPEGLKIESRFLTSVLDMCFIINKNSNL